MFCCSSGDFPLGLNTEVGVVGFLVQQTEYIPAFAVIKYFACSSAFVLAGVVSEADRLSSLCGSVTSSESS